MSTSWEKWPGLKDAVPRAELIVRRATFGKVHRAISDYRWIAATAGWNPAAEGLARRLNLGTEDLRVAGSIWRREPNQFIACAFKQSRASDANSRRTPIEKHLLSWKPTDMFIPAAQAAFALLERAATLNDAFYFDTHTDPRWEDSQFSIALAEDAEPPVAIDAGQLDDQVRNALDTFRTLTTEADLVAFLEAVLSRQAPAVLRLSSPQPLPMTVLPVLLLLPLEQPLPAFAGGVPSSNFPRAEDASQWTGICVQTGIGGVPDNAPATSPINRGKAKRMAAALLNADPAFLTSTSQSNAAMNVPSGARLALDGRLDNREGFELPATQPLMRAVRPDPPQTAPAPVETVSAAPEPLPEPSHTTASRAAQEKTVAALKEYAEGSIGVKRVDDLTSDKTAALDPQRAVDIAREVRRLVSEAGSFDAQALVDPELRAIFLEHVPRETSAKLDFCRAWLLAVAPYDDVVEAIGLSECQTVPPEPPLNVASRWIPATQWRRLAANLSPKTLQHVIDLSLAPGVEVEDRQRIEKWLRDLGWPTPSSGV